MRRVTLATLATLALLAASLPSQAQAQAANTLMPEGSSDVVLGLAGVIGPRANGSAEQRMGLVPVISVQWANGIFIDMNSVGMHLSDQPNLRYGPLLSPSRSRVTSDDGTTRGRWTPELGGFAEYQVSGALQVSTRLMYGGSSDRRGLRMRSSASLWSAGDGHQAFGVQVGVTLANRASLQDDFGLPDYRLHGGLRDATLGLHWRRDITHKSTIHMWLEEQRFLGSARASPRLERRAGTSLVTMLSWRY